MTKTKSSLIRIVVLVALIVAIGLLWRNFRLEKQVVNQKLLSYQLEILREGINTYKLINKKNPDSLLSLMATGYKVPGTDTFRTYVFTKLPVMPNGKIPDPFGNEYKYNKENGWVYTTTEGYQNW